MSCLAKDVHGNPCRNKGPFCKFHDYMKEYTPEMIAGCTLCKGCKKMKFKEMESCTECRVLGAEKRKKAKAEVVLCAKEGCKFKKSENKYCGKHQLCQFIDETSALGLKPCYNANRGCRTQMPMDGKSSCDVCLGKEREEDHKKRHVEPAKTETENECTRCRKMKPLEAFKGNVGETKTCMVCREANKRADEKRDMERVRELSRKNSAKPERKEVKHAWKEANYEKVAMYWIEARARMIEEDQEGYLKQNAEQAKKWREANPEKVKESNKARNENVDYHYLNYKRSAELKQLIFDLDKDYYLELISLPCLYCGIVQEKGFNGMDRLDSGEGYIVDNVVSCCEMCNFMKKCMSPDAFIKTSEHIATFQKKIDGLLCPDVFCNIKHVDYNRYKHKCIKREIEITITKEQFDKKRQETCYLCGKENSEIHQNGIDRVDSSIGYIESNIQSCCGSCNYMKSDYSLETFLEKCTLVALNHKIVETNIQNVPIVKGNKLTAEEKRERERVRKQAQREAQRKEYGKEEYKKIHAKKIADQRKKA